MSGAFQSSRVDAWNAVQWPTTRAREWTRDLVLNGSTVAAVIVIGSAARGCAHPGSDLDLVVVHRGPRPRLTPPPEIDLRWIEIGELEKCLADGDDVLAWAIAFGVPLHDPVQLWSATKTRWDARLPLPSPAISAKRAARARRYARELVVAGDEDAAAEQVLTMLTHRARGLLAARGTFALSRPELARQLRDIGEVDAASLLEGAISNRLRPAEILAAVDGGEPDS